MVDLDDINSSWSHKINKKIKFDYIFEIGLTTNRCDNVSS